MFKDHKKSSFLLGGVLLAAFPLIPGPMGDKEFNQLLVHGNTFLATDEGNVGVGTIDPKAKLTVGEPFRGSAPSSTFTTSAGTLGTSAGSELALANIGFRSENEVSLGIRAYRFAEGASWDSTAIALGMDVDNTARAPGSSIWISAKGRVGIGTASPGARLTVGPPFVGSAASSTFTTYAGTLGTSAGSELALANIGFGSSNETSFGIRAYRFTDGADWGTTSIGLGMDVDNTARAQQTSVWISANGGVGIGTASPATKLDVVGNINAHDICSGGSNSWAIHTPDDGRGGLYLAPGSDCWNWDWSKQTLFERNGDVSISASMYVSWATVTRSLQITGGGDIAEPFEVNSHEKIEPGMLVSIDPEQSGELRVTYTAYDKTIAGIVSGANGLNPGLVLKQEGTLADGSHPVALSGRVWCWANASNGAIQPGDLLTSSNIAGQAMKATDHKKSYGAVIGKAMTKLEEDEGLVLVLVRPQ